MSPAFSAFLDGGEISSAMAQRVDRIVGGGDAAVRHHLDEARAGLDLLARRPAHAVDPVGEPAKRPTRAEKLISRSVRRSRPEVAVAAGLAQSLAGND